MCISLGQDLSRQPDKKGKHPAGPRPTVRDLGRMWRERGQGHLGPFRLIPIALADALPEPLGGPKSVRSRKCLFT